ncbi:MAG: hypothetical protein M0R74_02300 [Dehalococcoidia bacterium]|nr:hypothetical protein [Dehalococcoidia bacterium]
MAYQPEDLTDLETVVLGVLSVGLPPSRAAGSSTFRVDHVTAVVNGLLREGRRDAFLRADGVSVSSDFRDTLRKSIETLADKGLVAFQPTGMPAAAGGFEAGLDIDVVDPDIHPALLDRYLGQLCMERLFNVPDVYPYLMERYSASGEVWRRLRQGGYAS